MAQSGQSAKQQQQQQQQQQPPPLPSLSLSSPPSTASNLDTRVSNVTSDPNNTTASSPATATSVPSPQSQLQSPLAAAASPSSSSSSASFDSSRPPSQHSSLTLASPASSTTADTTRKDGEELSPIKPLALPERHSVSSDDLNNAHNEQKQRNGNENGDLESAITSSPTPPPFTPTITMSEAHQQQLPSSAGSRISPKSKTTSPSFLLRVQAWLARRQLFGHALGLATLVATLVGLLVFGYRSYKLDIYNSHMAYLQVCWAQIQGNANVDSGCQSSMAQSVPPSPYRLIERAFNATRAAYASVIGDRFDAHIESLRSPEPPGIIDNLQIFIPQLILMLIPLSYMVFFLWRRLKERLRAQSQAQDSFSSPVRNEVHITRHHPEQGDAVTSELGVRVVKHKPEEQHHLGQLMENLRHVLERDPSEENALGYLRRRKWKSAPENDGDEDDDRSHVSWFPEPNWGLGSESTLVSGWDKDRSGRRLSSVTIKSSMGDEGEGQEYAGLIELKTKGKNRTFFDPKTGEFIRLTPWKASAATDDEDDSRIHGDEKGDSKKALARMGAGAVALGGGKSLDEEIMEELDRSDLLGAADIGQVPQRAGDTVTGFLTNECPTGMPNII